MKIRFSVRGGISMKNVQPTEREKERSRLSCFWQEAFNDLTDLKLDVQAAIKEIYATYIFFETEKDYNVVLRADLSIMKWICKITGYNTYPINCKSYEFDVITEILYGLIWSIEHNFPRRYYLRSLPLEVMEHKSSLEADMSCYETYEKAIKKMMEIYAKEHCEDEN